MEKIKITKFFDVKQPIGLQARDESATNYNIGSDLYMPYDTEAFRAAFLQANCEMYMNLQVNTSETINYRISEFTYNCCDGISENDAVLMRVETDLRTNKSIYQIFENCQIPSGIGFLLSKSVWLEVRSKSSNFKNGFTVVHGTVDMNYTYGVGIQLILLKQDSIILESEQKIAQVVLQKAVPINSLEFVELKEFENDKTVLKYRNKRVGGFGSGGKFEKENEAEVETKTKAETKTKTKKNISPVEDEDLKNSNE